MDTTDITTTQSTLIASKLLAALKSATLDLAQEMILASLEFPEMGNRQDRILQPSHSTYNWIVRDVRYVSASRHVYVLAGL